METQDSTHLSQQQTSIILSNPVECPGCHGGCPHCGGQVKQRANRAHQGGREKTYCCTKCQKLASHKRCHQFSKWGVCSVPGCENRVRPDGVTGRCHQHYRQKIRWNNCKKQDCHNPVHPDNKTGYCRFHGSIGQYEQLKLKLAELERLRAERDAIDKKLAAAQVEVEKWSEVGRDAEDETWAMADELYHQKWDWDTIKARCDQIFSVNKTVKAYQEGRRRYLKRKKPTK
jgi:hypothetical protein